MSHQPITIVATNGKRYVSTVWALGVTVTLLMAVIVGWAGWLQSVVTSDHDKLIEAVAAISNLDEHLNDWRNELRDALEIIIDDHQMFRERFTDGGK